MTRRSPSVALACALIPVVLGSCGTDIVPKQVDEPCTRTAQCDVGLECTAGVCQPVADAGADAG